MINASQNAPPLLQRSKIALCSEVSGGFVIMDIKSGRYFSLNETGSEIWRALEQPISKAGIIEALCEHFVIDAQTCADRAEPFIARLLEYGLIEPL